METSASFEARSAPLPYPTVSQRTYGSVRGVPGDRYPYRDRYPKLRERSRLAVREDLSSQNLALTDRLCLVVLDCGPRKGNGIEEHDASGKPEGANNGGTMDGGNPRTKPVCY